MKTIVIILAVTLGGVFTSMACDGSAFMQRITGSGKLVKQQRAVTDFHGIEAGGAIEVIVTAQQEYNVEVEADDNVISHVLTNVKGGVLHIETDMESINDATIRVRIPCQRWTSWIFQAHRMQRQRTLTQRL